MAALYFEITSNLKLGICLIFLNLKKFTPIYNRRISHYMEKFSHILLKYIESK